MRVLSRWKAAFDRWIGRSALGRAEALIAQKLDEIAQTEKFQIADELSIQKRIDDLDTRITALRKERRRVESEMQSARNRNQKRAAQLLAELNELSANADSLSKPNIIGTPASKTIEFRSVE